MFAFLGGGVADKLAVYLGDVIAGLQSRPIGRPAVQDRHRGENVVLEDQFHAGLGPRSLSAPLVAGVLFGGKVGGVRVQRIHHAPQGTVEQLHVVFLEHRFGGNFIQGLRQQSQGFIIRRGICRYPSCQTAHQDQDGQHALTEPFHYHLQYLQVVVAPWFFIFDF